MGKRNHHKNTELTPLSLGKSFSYFAIFSVLLFVATHYGIPGLTETTGLLSVLSWFVCGGVCVFVPLFITAIVAFKREGYAFNLSAFKARFRLHRMTKADWIWTIGAIIVIGVGMGLITVLWDWLHKTTGFFHPLSTSPPFLEFHGFEKGQRWYLIFWLIFFFFNIFGEELLWRGYILPRQELAQKRFAWLYNGIFWTIFHFSFGLDLTIMLLPILFILPYVVQKRKNTWIGIIIHALINGPAFIAISLSLI